MKPIIALDSARLVNIRYVFTDIDDTLTTHGRLSSETLGLMEMLKQANVSVIPVTGRPAGWCHGLPRLWPIAGIVGENGACAYWVDPATGWQQALYWAEAQVRAADRQRLDVIAVELLSQLPFAQAAQDQALRLGDICFDHAENRDPLGQVEKHLIINYLKSAGCQTAISSIHIHGYFGERNKHSMTQRFISEVLRLSTEQVSEQSLYIGDSMNDEPMFAAFPLSLGVANIALVSDQLRHKPHFVTEASAGEGFNELARLILQAKKA
jgi:HAD superfamily hydrolase (TIGR01484 family)